METINNILLSFSKLSIDKIFQYSFIDIINMIKTFIDNSYQFFYPFILKYMILLNDNKILAWIIIFVLFNIFYLIYIYLRDKTFSILGYLIWFVIMPISVIILWIIIIDIIIKKFFIYKILWVEYPYIKYQERLEQLQMAKYMKEIERYNSRIK